MQKLDNKTGLSHDLVQENLNTIRAIFPEAVTEDGVDFEVLRQLLGDEVTNNDEKYELTWHGKKNARQLALSTSSGTLRPCPAESASWETTKNIFIEGDNLEVLKLLQRSYANKIKMIYLDPPYNTGKDFIYSDKFQDNLEAYLKYTAQKDESGRRTSSNTESSGRYHTNWLNMMYPRLKLARSLLQSDGAIFISIDDGEVTNLRKLADEIFGEENFIHLLKWKRKKQPSFLHGHVASVMEYICIYAKSASDLEKLSIEKRSDSNTRIDNQANKISERTLSAGVRVKLDVSITKIKAGTYPSKTMSTEYLQDVNIENGRTTNSVTIKAQFRNSKTDIEQFVAEDVIFITKNHGLRRDLLPEELEKRKMITDLLLDWGDNQESDKESKILFPNQKVFDYPKPVKLIKNLVASMFSESQIILDFFSGSCTTAHAVMELNAEDSGNRRYIMVQIPEPCDSKSAAFKEGYQTIAEIGKERIRRVTAKIKKEKPTSKVDLGFKVFKLDTSNILAWNPDRNDLEQTLIDNLEHLAEGRSESDVLYELLLKRGVDLVAPIEQKTFACKTIYRIGAGALFACLATSITNDVVEELAQGIIHWWQESKPTSDTQVVFRDSAFANDIVKTNMTAILEQHGLSHVRSL